MFCGCVRHQHKGKLGDFPGGPVVKSPASNARDAGSIPGGGTKTPHAAGQLSPRAATIEQAHTLQLESPRAATTEPVCHN